MPVLDNIAALKKHGKAIAMGTIVVFFVVMSLVIHYATPSKTVAAVTSVFSFAIGALSVYVAEAQLGAARGYINSRLPTGGYGMGMGSSSPLRW